MAIHLPLEPLENYTYGELPNTRKDGFSVEDWYLDEALTQKIDYATFEPTEDTTVYAKYTEKMDVTFTVEGEEFKKVKNSKSLYSNKAMIQQSILMKFAQKILVKLDHSYTGH